MEDKQKGQEQEVEKDAEFPWKLTRWDSRKALRFAARQLRKYGIAYAWKKHPGPNNRKTAIFIRRPIQKAILPPESAQGGIMFF